MKPIAKSYCVVLPSYKEGVPRVLLEAMSMGKPIITTDTNGCKECILPPLHPYENLLLGQNGILIPKKDSKALAIPPHPRARHHATTLHHATPRPLNLLFLLPLALALSTPTTTPLAFWLLGSTTCDNPSAISQEMLLAQARYVDYLGECEDVRNHIAKSYCVVLPSSYKEGVAHTPLTTPRTTIARTIPNPKTPLKEAV